MTSSCPVFGSPKCGDYDCNLHWTWDTLLLEHTGYSEEEYVGRLNTLIAQKHLEKQAGGTPVDWANESHSRRGTSSKRTRPQLTKLTIRPTSNLVNQKLALAGLRLATLLNDTLGKAPAAKVNEHFRNMRRERTLNNIVVHASAILIGSAFALYVAIASAACVSVLVALMPSKSKACLHSRRVADRHEHHSTGGARINVAAVESGFA